MKYDQISEAYLQVLNENTQHHITKIYGDDVYDKATLATSNNATPEDLDRLVVDPSDYVALGALENPKATTQHIKQAFNSERMPLKMFAAEDSRLPKELLDQAIQHPNDYIREAATHNPKLTHDHISTALRDSSEFVRASAASSRKVTPEHISFALSDPSSAVRSKAIRNRRANQDHINAALKDESISVRHHAFNHPNNTRRDTKTLLGPVEPSKE